MGKIATIGEIQAALWLPNPQSGWTSNRCPTRGELSAIWGGEIAWVGDSGYASNRLVELDMVGLPELDIFMVVGESANEYASISCEVEITYLVDGFPASQEATALHTGPDPTGTLYTDFLIPASATQIEVVLFDFKVKLTSAGPWIEGTSWPVELDDNMYYFGFDDVVSTQVLTLVGTPGNSYYISRTGYISVGYKMRTPIHLNLLSVLSDGGVFAFGINLYLRNTVTGSTAMIPAANNYAGNTVTFDIQP